METLSDRFTEEYDSTKTCPNLGIRGDPETRFAFSSRGHLCFGLNPPEAIQLDYQDQYCLKPIYLTCAIYQKDLKGDPPSEISASPKPRAKPRWGYLVLGVVLLASILVLGIISEWDNLAFAGKISPITFEIQPSTAQSAANGEMITPSANAESPARLPEETPIHPTATALPTTTTATIHPTWTVQPTLTFTPPPTPGPGLGTPFGADLVYVIYRVQEGQSLQSLAVLYDTSPEAIQAANVLRAGRTVWPGDIIVVPVGQEDPELVIQFTYQFINKKTNLLDLAAETGVPAEDIRQYNLLGADEWIPAGRWLIIPALGE